MGALASLDGLVTWDLNDNDAYMYVQITIHNLNLNTSQIRHNTSLATAGKD